MNLAELTTLVIDALRVELRSSTIAIDATTPLEDIQGFNSIAVVGVLERLEREVGIEMDPTLILPETFATPQTIAEGLLQSRQPTNSERV
jgi:acyl carrier protein